MSEDTMTPIDENTRRYYLDVMGVQCWESIKPAVQTDDLKTDRSVNNIELNVISLEDTIQQCDKCQLHEQRKQALPGRGRQSAELMFVLLSPDEHDDAALMICSGEANDLLTKMLAAINVSIDDVYITSLLKCCVPATHTVSTTELHQCKNYLKQQVRLVEPKLLVVLGKTAASCMLQQDVLIDELRAATNTIEQSKQFESVPLFVSYSPRELLQQPDNKRKAWLDLQQIQKIIQA
jgi:uracil-DNA glycosylase